MRMAASMKVVCSILLVIGYTAEGVSLLWYWMGSIEGEDELMNLELAIIKEQAVETTNGIAGDVSATMSALKEVGESLMQNTTFDNIAIQLLAEHLSSATSYHNLGVGLWNRKRFVTVDFNAAFDFTATDYYYNTTSGSMYSRVASLSGDGILKVKDKNKNNNLFTDILDGFSSFHFKIINPSTDFFATISLRYSSVDIMLVSVTDGKLLNSEVALPELFTETALWVNVNYNNWGQLHEYTSRELLRCKILDTSVVFGSSQIAGVDVVVVRVLRSEPTKSGEFTAFLIIVIVVYLLKCLFGFLTVRFVCKQMSLVGEKSSGTNWKELRSIQELYLSVCETVRDLQESLQMPDASNSQSDYVDAPLFDCGPLVYCESITTLYICITATDVMIHDIVANILLEIVSATEGFLENVGGYNLLAVWEHPLNFDMNITATILASDLFSDKTVSAAIHCGLATSSGLSGTCGGSVRRYVVISKGFHAAEKMAHLAYSLGYLMLVDEVAADRSTSFTDIEIVATSVYLPTPTSGPSIAYLLLPKPESNSSSSNRTLAIAREICGTDFGAAINLINCFDKPDYREEEVAVAHLSDLCNQKIFNSRNFVTQNRKL